MAASHTASRIQPLILQNPQPSLQNPLPRLPGLRASENTSPYFLIYPCISLSGTREAELVI